MLAIDENTITDAAIDQMAATPNPRLKQIMEAAVRHLHAFAREVDLTPDEWIEGIKFLTATGQMCTPFRQEFILLSDTMGLSSLVNSLHDKRAISESTKSSLLGPFYRKDSPVKQLGDTIASPGAKGQEITISGKVVDSQGNGIANASIEIWQPDDEGWYDLQKHDPKEMDLRATFFTDSEGNYSLRTICPLGYMIPMDGPVGDLIRAQARHGYRPAHIHFLIGAPGHRESVTALYISGDPHLESDTVFGVTESLVAEVKDGAVHYDFMLGDITDTGSGRVGADPSEITPSDIVK